MQKTSLSVSYDNERHSVLPPVGRIPLTPSPAPPLCLMNRVVSRPEFSQTVRDLLALSEKRRLAFPVSTLSGKKAVLPYVLLLTLFGGRILDHCQGER